MTRAEVATKACELFDAITELLHLTPSDLAALKSGDRNVHETYGTNMKLFADPAAPIFEMLMRKRFDLERARLGKL